MRFEAAAKPKTRARGLIRAPITCSTGQRTEIIMIKINAFLIMTAAAGLFAADRAGLPMHGPYFPCYDRIIEDRWLMFIRPQAYAGSDLKKVGRRRVAVKESRDLKTWTQEHTVLVPKEGDANHFYGMTVFHCGDLFWGGLQRYETVTHHVDCELVWRPVTPFSAPLW